jgi:hypothetical protein
MRGAARGASKSICDGLCSRSECGEWHGGEPDEPAFDWADPDAYADEIDTALFYNRHADPYARIDVADEKPGCTFMLGTHRPHWLHPGKREHKPAGPLFVSVRQMRDRRKSAYPVSDVSFALDSGGFTELRKFNGWHTTEADYAAYVMRIAGETLGLAWAASQDYMCEADALAATGLTVPEHQRLTVERFLELRKLAPGIRWLPVLQGVTPADYWAHVAMYEAAGVHLRSMRLVGLGSICRRQTEAEIVELARELSAGGIRLHGFGVKLEGLALDADAFVSTDSLAWSIHERLHKTGRANCQTTAERYRAKAIRVIEIQAAGIAPAVPGGAVEVGRRRRNTPRSIVLRAACPV